MSKTLVAYFSATGNTARAAERLAKAIGADLHEIRPKVPYTKKDLDWTDTHSRSTLEMNDLSSRPAMAEQPGDLSAYDTVFLGFPIWWYVAPRIISTFVESCDLTGKKVVLFATSGGSGFGKALDELRPLCPGADWEEGKLLNRISDEALAELAKR